MFSTDFVDFGIHVADNKTVYKKITVRNSGSTPAPYRIEYKGEHPIGFSPQSAMVQPNSAISVEVKISSIKIIVKTKSYSRCLY